MSYSEITSNLGFRLIDFASDPYHEDEWFNWQLLDGIVTLNQAAIPFAVGGGTASAVTVNYTPDQTLAVGLTIAFTVPATNTGAVTVAVDGQAAKPLKINSSDPSAGSLPVGMLVKAVYDGTNFNVTYPAFALSSSNSIIAGVSGATPVSGADTFTVHNSTDAGISILAPDGTVGKFYFGSASKSNGGGLYYDHSVNRLYLRANQYNGPYLDADKVLRQPDIPFVHAYKTYAAAAAPANGTVIVFDTEVFDNASDYNNATGVFTARISGVYQFMMDNSCTGSAADATQTMAFYKNGVQQTPTLKVHQEASGYTGKTHTVYLTLAAGDTVDFRMVTVTATNLTGQFYLSIKLVK